MKSFDFKKLTASLKLPKRGEYKSISAKAQHDWKIMLVSFFVLWIIIISLSMFLFFQIEGGKIFQTNAQQVENKPVINKAVLEDVVNSFEAKKARGEGLKTQKLNIPDPSL
jgi:hypothetical protein